MLPKIQQDILLNLAKYKFLSRKQMKRLGIAMNNSNLTNYCKGLVESKFIDLIDAKRLGLGYIYFLTKKGAQFLSRDFEDNHSINFFTKKSNKDTIRTLWHCHNSIYCQIECTLSALDKKVPLDFYIKDIAGYRRTNSSNPVTRRATAISVSDEILEPDACFLVNNRLFALEYENQTFTKRSFEKMLLHSKALKHRSLGKHYSLYHKESYKLHRVLVVYESKDVLRNAIKRIGLRLDNEFTQGKWFLFKHIDEVLPKVTWKEPVTETLDYFDNWLTLRGERVNMLS